MIQPSQNLSGSDYQMTASIQDIHGFRTGSTTHDITIVTAPLGTLTTNGTFYIIESAAREPPIRTNSNGFSGTQGDLGVTYSPQYNSTKQFKDLVYLKVQVMLHINLLHHPPQNVLSIKSQQQHYICKWNINDWPNQYIIQTNLIMLVVEV